MKPPQAEPVFPEWVKTLFSGIAFGLIILVIIFGAYHLFATPSDEDRERERIERKIDSLSQQRRESFQRHLELILRLQKQQQRTNP